MKDALSPLTSDILVETPKALRSEASRARPASLPDDRRRLGAFYTSEHVAKILVSWALNGHPGPVLDPSYGGCAFLRVALDHLRDLGASNPAELVHGTDIDPATAPWRAHLVGQGVPETQLLGVDFISTRPGVDLPRCRAVVGNPPYVRHHWLSAEQHRAYAPLRDTYRLTARASTWAYFVLHALSFVEPGGRVAFLLPGAVLHDGYAAAVREALAVACNDVVLVRMRERLFEQALEETVVLLAQVAEHHCELNSAASRAHIAYLEVDGVPALASLLDRWPIRAGAHENPAGVMRLHKTGHLPTGAARLLDRCWESGLLHPLRDIAELRIGIVTGANAFFVRARDDVPHDPLVTSVPIVSRSTWLDRPVWMDADNDRLTQKGRKTQLVIIDPAWPRTSPRGDASRFSAQVDEAEKKDIHKRHYCTKRSPWYSLTDTRVPDAFLPYMGRLVPQPILNSSTATCTNAIHRLMWLDDPNPDQAFGRILGGWSSLWQVVGEVAGRHYGGGVLKLEPRAAGTLPMLDPDLSDPLICRLLNAARDASSQGDRAAVCRIADALISHHLGLSETEMSLLTEAALCLRKSRPRSGN